MILYIDTSALAKRYIQEQGSEDVAAWMDFADVIFTTLVTRVEMASTLTRAIKANRLPQKGVQDKLEDFRADWEQFQRIPIDDVLVAYADTLACQYALRGYDAIHLASALTLREMLHAPVTVATFDAELRESAQKAGLGVLPE